MVNFCFLLMFIFGIWIIMLFFGLCFLILLRLLGVVERFILFILIVMKLVFIWFWLKLLILIILGIGVVKGLFGFRKIWLVFINCQEVLLLGSLFFRLRIILCRVMIFSVEMELEWLIFVVIILQGVFKGCIFSI